MWELLEAIETTSFSLWVREARTVFAYPTFIAFHSFGMAFLVGTSAGIALRALGFASGIPIAPLEKFFRVIMIAFWVSFVAGTVLFLIDGRYFLSMPAFYIKLVTIAAAVVSTRLLRIWMFGDPASRNTGILSMKTKVAAVATLFFWATAIAVGRVTAYEPFIQRQTAVADVIFTVVMLAAGLAAFRLFASIKKSLRRTNPLATSH